MKRPFILHPFFFAAFPVLSLFVANIDEVRPDVLPRPLIASLAMAGLLLLLFRLVSKKWRRAAMAASLVMVLFFSYGHAYRFIFTNFPYSIFARANVLLAVWATVLILGVYVLLRIVKKTRQPTRLLNIVSTMLLVSPVLFAFWSLGVQRAQVHWKQPAHLTPQPGPNWDGTKPDIYYIILDGYGSEAALREFYGVENGPFLDGLRQRGFTITSESATNYWRTALSLSSSLNFSYLDDLADLPRDSSDQRPVEEMISNSAVRRFLTGLGYRTVAFSTGYPFSEMRSADVYYPSQRVITPFEVNLLIGSMAIYWVDWAAPVYHRMDIVQHFQELEEAAVLEGPKFVFAHMVTPHPPFVFDADGKPVAPMGSGDGTVYSGGVEHYLNGYAGQVQYTNRLVEKMIDRILETSKTPPIIIVQGDHGPGAYLDWQSVEKTCLRERFPILNAYYLPGKAEAAAAIPQDISPVNTFRVLFNTYFDTRLPVETNRHFAVLEPYLYNHEEVTGRLDWCPAPVGASGNP